jgi:FAD/FMN-containing dehydrogenase
MDEVLIALHRRIKAAFDPNHVLNPGKIFEQTKARAGTT